MALSLMMMGVSHATPPASPGTIRGDSLSLSVRPCPQRWNDVGIAIRIGMGGGAHRWGVGGSRGPAPLHHPSIYSHLRRQGSRRKREASLVPSAARHSREIGEDEEEAAEEEERTSPDEVKREMQRCYELIHKLGRGVIYLGSSRVKTDHPHYLRAVELAREIAKLLDCTTWTGAGPGLMDAAIKGALEAKKPIGGFKIAKESGEWTSSNFHPYLPPEAYLTCRFFSARKHGLVDAAVRNSSSDMTAVVAFPGGIGTLDEVFEILALIQLERMGSNFPVPFLLVNYDSFYSKLLDFLDECETWGTVARGEVSSLWKVCNGNSEALEYLADFYDLPHSRRNDKIGVGREKGITS